LQHPKFQYYKMTKADQVVRLLARLNYGARQSNPEQYQRSFLQSFFDQHLISDADKTDLSNPRTHSLVFNKIQSTLTKTNRPITISKHIPH